MKKVKKLLLGSTIAIFTLGGSGCDYDDIEVPVENNESDEVTEWPGHVSSWTKVYTLKGSDSKSSDIFKLKGSKAKISIKSLAGEFTLYVVPENKDIKKDKIEPEISSHQITKGDLKIQKPAGNYYIEIKGMGEWEVTVYELVSVI